MTERYKLLGRHWDGITSCIERVSLQYECCVRNYDEQYDLLDWKFFARKIKFSKLLATEREEQVTEILQNVNMCEAVVIEIDFFPLQHNETVEKFLSHRLSQMIWYLTNRCKITDVRIFASKSIQSILIDYIKI